MTPDPRLFGPLQRAWERRFGGGVGEPLIVGGKLILSSDVSRAINGGTEISAVRPRDGKVLWSRRIAYSSPYIASSSGVVVTVDRTTTVSVLSVSDGRLLWRQRLTDGETAGYGAAVIADGGTVFASVAGGAYALELATGRPLWAQDVGLFEGPGGMAVDNGRVFLSADCGDTLALSRATGQELWRGDGNGLTCFGGRAAPLVAGGRVAAPAGYLFDAVTGAPRGRLPVNDEQVPGAAAQGRLIDGNGPLAAYDLATARRAWRTARVRVSAPPKVAGVTTYGAYVQEGRGGYLSGVATGTGRLLSLTRIPPLGDAPGNIGTSVAVGAGRVFVGGENRVLAYRPKLTPGRAGVDMLFPPARDYITGGRFRWVAGVGSALRAKRPKVELQGQVLGKGRWRTVDSRRALVDGGAVLRSKLMRNTRYRAAVKGARSKAVTLFAYPEFDARIRRTSRRFGVIKGRVGAVPRQALKNRKLFAYHGKAGERTFVRMGGARLHGRRASIRFRLLRHVGRRDVIGLCVKGLARAGWGRSYGLAKRCGAGRVPYPPKRRGRGVASAPGQDASAAISPQPISPEGASALGAAAIDAAQR